MRMPRWSELQALSQLPQARRSSLLLHSDPWSRDPLHSLAEKVGNVLSVRLKLEQCVVVKYFSDDAFVITAYLTDTIKAGEILWPTK
jgi:hypothetical protein